ncbi:serine hydrolase domain-containing protein [Nannocystis pusilla]|uniref:serine hydrolase domain-containing protein n=1 Tax=Nannocystis pusilla TaxID=889268 RepID=UPI003B7D2958
MNKPFLATTLLFTSLALPQTALADPPSPPVCSDFPRMGLEYALGSYAAVDLDPDLEDTLDDHLANIIAGSAVTEGAVLMVARHGKIVYHEAAGLRDGNTALGGDAAITMPTNAIFDLESMTKPFTATVILEMDADGLLDIDDLVIDYLPEFEYDPSLATDIDKTEVTIRDLVRYTSGLYVDATANPIYNATDPYLTMSHEASYYAPNEKVMYSDLGYRLLGHLAEVAYADAHPTAQKTFAPSSRSTSPGRWA